MRCFIGIDLGSTTTKAVVMDENLNVLGRGITNSRSNYDTAAAIAKQEYMFPFVTVVECPEAKMVEAIGPTLVCTAITNKPDLRRKLIDAVHIDRLNLGPVPTIQLNWLQPHEGNIVEFLFRARAFQTA